jgi:hypothetical protein
MPVLIQCGRDEGILATMKRRLRLLCFFGNVMVLGSLLGAPVEPPPKTSENFMLGERIEPLPEKTKTFSVEKPGITVTMRVPEEPVVKSKMTLEIQIKNTGTERLVVWTGGYVPDCIMSMVNDRGEPCAMTIRGGNTIGPNITQRAQWFGVVIAPSGTRKWTIRLDRFFQIKPNQYFLTTNMDYNLAGWQMLRVDKVAFTIREE